MNKQLTSMLSLVVIVSLVQFGLAASTVIFNDGFESGTIEAANWSTIGDNLSVVSSPVNSGTYAVEFIGANVPENTLASISIDTTGYENIVLEYARAFDQLESADDFIVEYSTNGGSTWTTLEAEDGTGATYTEKTFSLSAAADDNPNLMIQFSLDANAGTQDFAYLDDVVISGDLIQSVSITNPLAGDFFNSDISIEWTQAGLVDLDIHYMTGIADCQNLADWTYSSSNRIANDAPASDGEYTWDTSSVSDGLYCLQILDDSSSSIRDIVGHFTIDHTAPIVTNTTLTCDEGSSTTVSITASDATSGIASYDWSNAETTPSFTYTCVDGDDTETLTVDITDNAGNVAPGMATITINNVDPVASPIGPYSNTEGVAISFSGSATDAGGDTLTYTWDFGDSTGTVVGQTPTHAYAQDGTYTVTLTVTDGDGGSHMVTTTATIADTTPTASFTDNAPKEEGQTVSFTDTSSAYDTPLSYSWTFGDGDTSTDENPTHTYAVDGTYTVTLTVTDSDGSVDSTSSTVTITDSTPTADFTVSDATPTEGDTVSFTDTSSAYDTPLSYSWTFGDGGTSTDEDPTYVYVADGTYTVILTVTDSDGSTDTDTMTIVVGDTSPTASFSASKTTVNESETISFTDSSTAYDGIASWSWTFGDGDTSTSQNPTHAYTDDGTYTVTLTVTDGDGSTDSTTVTITVENVVPVFDEVNATVWAVVSEPFALDINASTTPATTITYALLSGPTWLSINTATGELSGTPNYNATDKEFVVTVSASDGSDVSTQTFTIKVSEFVINLESGWNWISVPLYPLDDNNSVDAVLGAGNYAEVWTYIDGEWYVSTAVGPNNLDSIVPGRGYIVNASTDVSIPKNGKEAPGALVVPVSIDLSVGYNLIGHYGLKELNISAALDDSLAGKYNPNVLGENGGVNTMQTTRAYWLQIITSDTANYGPSVAARLSNL